MFFSQLSAPIITPPVRWSSGELADRHGSVLSWSRGISSENDAENRGELMFCKCSVNDDHDWSWRSFHGFFHWIFEGIMMQNDANDAKWITKRNDVPSGVIIAVAGKSPINGTLHRKIIYKCRIVHCHGWLPESSNWMAYQLVKFMANYSLVSF